MPSLASFSDGELYAELARRKPIATLRAEVANWRARARDAAIRESALRGAYDALAYDLDEQRRERVWIKLRSAVVDGVEANRKLGYAESALADAKAAEKLAGVTA